MQKALVDKGCEFCKLRDSSEFRVYDGRSAIAFLDFRPVFPGHTLVAPKVHCETIDRMPDELVGECPADSGDEQAPHRVLQHAAVL